MYGCGSRLSRREALALLAPVVLLQSCSRAGAAEPQENDVVAIQEKIIGIVLADGTIEERTWRSPHDFVPKPRLTAPRKVDKIRNAVGVSTVQYLHYGTTESAGLFGIRIRQNGLQKVKEAYQYEWIP